MKTGNWTRRLVLRGAGVALSLPWLETFAPRTARAAAAAGPRRRLITLYFRHGAEPDAAALVADRPLHRRFLH